MTSSSRVEHGARIRKRIICCKTWLCLLSQGEAPWIPHSESSQAMQKSSLYPWFWPPQFEILILIPEVKTLKLCRKPWDLVYSSHNQGLIWERPRPVLSGRASPRLCEWVTALSTPCILQWMGTVLIFFLSFQLLIHRLTIKATVDILKDQAKNIALKMLSGFLRKVAHCTGKASSSHFQVTTTYPACDHNNLCTHIQ